MSSKKKSEFMHARKRFMERLGIDLTQNLHEKLVADCRKHKFTLVKEQSLRIKIFETQIENRDIYLVYDKFRKEIVTVLYKEEGIPNEYEII